MVGGDEAYRNGLLSIVPGYRPLPVILGRIDVAQPLWNVIVENLRIVLFHYSFERRLRLVICPVGRGVAADASVSYSQCEICIREECFLRLKLHLTSHIVPVKQSDFTVQAFLVRVDVACIPFPEFIGEPYRRIRIHGCRICCFQFRNLVRIREDGFSEQCICPVAYTSVFRQLFFHIFRTELFGNIFSECAHGRHERFLVDGKVIILVECLRQGCRPFIVAAGKLLRYRSRETAKLHGRGRLAVILPGESIRFQCSIQ